MTCDGDGKVDSALQGAQVPEDFPRAGALSTLPGAQPKFQARYLDGRFVVGPSPQELQLRYTACREYTEVLPAYCEGLQSRHPDWTTSKVLEHTGRALAQRHQRMSGLEIDWVVTKVAAELGWNWVPGVLWRGRPAG